MYHQDLEFEVMFVSPDLNMTYYQYTGDRGDSAMIQLIQDRDTEKLSLYAFIREKMLPLLLLWIAISNEFNSLSREVSWQHTLSRGDQYNIMGCGRDCHLWVKTKYKERTL